MGRRDAAVSPLGLWLCVSAGLPAVLLLDCGHPGQPLSGNVVLDDHLNFSFVAGATANFSCPLTGHRLVGDGQRTCQSDGTWSGQEARCVNSDVELECGQPETPANGNVNVIVERDVQADLAGVDYLSNVGGLNSIDTIDSLDRQDDLNSLDGPDVEPAYQVAVHWCHAGFELDGPERRVCRAGTWSDRQPVCLPSSGFVDENSYSFDDSYGDMMDYAEPVLYEDMEEAERADFNRVLAIVLGVTLGAVFVAIVTTEVYARCSDRSRRRDAMNGDANETRPLEEKISVEC